MAPGAGSPSSKWFWESSTTQVWALIDMNMLAASPSQDRSLDEYDALLAAAGLRRTAVLATSSPQSIIVAVVAPADHGPATTCPSKSIVGLG